MSSKAEFKGQVSVVQTFPGRAPVLIDNEEMFVACVDKAGMDVNIFRK